MLGFIVAGLKLVGRIIVKAVKAAAIGTVVGCASSNWKDLKNTTDEILNSTLDEVNKKKEEVENKPKDYKYSFKEKMALLAFIINTILKVTYAIILGGITIVACVIDCALEVIKTIIFKSNKEEEILCSE